MDSQVLTECDGEACALMARRYVTLVSWCLDARAFRVCALFALHIVAKAIYGFLLPVDDELLFVHSSFVRFSASLVVRLELF